MAAASAPAAARTLDCRGRSIGLGRATAVVGILNVTPDSFFDGGRWTGVPQAEAQARRMAAEGAAAIDVGGQSTRPGHAEIGDAEEIARVVPVLRAVVPAVSVPVSIDTYKPAVARAALDAGAHWVNDVHGFQDDPAMARLVAEYRCPAVLMHHDRGFAGASGDVVDRLCAYFDRSLSAASEAGVDQDRIVLDPGLGFFKTPAQQLEILRRLPELKRFGCPILVGVSRKSLIGHVLGGQGPEDRLEGTLAVTVLAALQGTELVRVHDVGPNVRAARMAEAILGS